MGAAVTVACVLRSGGDFEPWHVSALRDQLATNLPGARFVCLSDVDVDCERIPLETDWRGWWAKLELFRALQTKTLYFDLDTIVRAPLGHIAAYPHRFTIGMNWRVPGEFNSGFMAWDGDYSWIAEGFTNTVAKKYRSTERWGDQGYLTDKLKGQAENAWELFPGDFVSYKKHCRHGVPDGARVICFHGRPRPWYVRESWARSFYERAAA